MILSFLSCLHCTALLTFRLDNSQSVIMSDLTFLGEPVLTWGAAGRLERVVVFLHGSGDSGPGLADWLDSLGLRSRLETNTAVLFPSARPRPYSMYGGEVSSVWHDRRDLDISAWEDQEGMETMTSSLDSFISQICGAWNLNRQNVIMGGFRDRLHFIKKICSAFCENVLRSEI